MERFHEVLERARGGDRAAAAELHRGYAGFVAARVRADLPPMLRKIYDTDDLAQSVFVEMLRELDGFEDRGEDAFRHWLAIKAENKVRAKLRKHLGRNGRRRETGVEGRPERVDPSPAADPAAGAETSDLGRAAGRLLASLDSPDRDVVWMRIELGLSFADIARRLELPSAEAARKRHARSLLAMRARLSPR